LKRYEFDLGWAYIRAMQAIGWARVKKVPPKLQLGDIRPVADEKTLEAVITNRYEVMARYAREMRRACSDEISVLQARGQDLSILKAARRWLHRDDDRVPADARNQVDQARAASPALDKMLTMREELRQMWLNTSVSREQLTHDLQAWCKRAEDSGIARLQVFSQRLRAAHA
jgi:stearoyl-CoA desaturase (delta-9 desaturase)